MAFSCFLEKHRYLCHCEGWVLFPARSNPLPISEIALSGLYTAKEHAYSTLLATTRPFFDAITFKAPEGGVTSGAFAFSVLPPNQ